MKTLIEVQIGDGTKRPTVSKVGGKWCVTGEASGCVGYVRGLWVRTFDPGNDSPKDGKGFLVGPTRRLLKG